VSAKELSPVFNESSVMPHFPQARSAARRRNPVSVAAVLAEPVIPVYMNGMNFVFDMDDRARLPWRFHADRLAQPAGL
jgi:hypothetical protein